MATPSTGSASSHPHGLAAASHGARLRVDLHLEDRVSQAEAVVLGETGALVVCAEPLRLGTLLSLRNAATGGMARFEVVWNGGTDASGRHKLGLAMVSHHPGFWIEAGVS
jgi:hypothetical protein